MCLEWLLLKHLYTLFLRPQHFRSFSFCGFMPWPKILIPFLTWLRYNSKFWGKKKLNGQMEHLDVHQFTKKPNSSKKILLSQTVGWPLESDSIYPDSCWQTHVSVSIWRDGQRLPSHLPGVFRELSLDNFSCRRILRRGTTMTRNWKISQSCK